MEKWSDQVSFVTHVEELERLIDFIRRFRRCYFWFCKEFISNGSLDGHIGICVF
jgi:hypothetical protein